tara:strand:- start:2624 stop:2884 length:261 start_codon:yes stop_codon:yes gene_type:complete
MLKAKANGKLMPRTIEPGTSADISTSVASVEDNETQSTGDQIQDQLSKIQAQSEDNIVPEVTPDQQVSAFTYRRRRIHGKRRRRNC